MIYKKENCCAVTGHRTLGGDFDERILKKVLLKVIKNGFNTFFIGMAVGFDTACFHILENIRKENPEIKLIACIPCVTQSYKFNERQRKDYEQMLESADEKVFISENYTPYCMFKRNMFMVDNSVLLIAYLKKGATSGGSYNTVNYAKKKNVPIINIADL